MNSRTGRRGGRGRSGEPKAAAARQVIALMGAPGWFAPVVIDGQPYVDGGVCSPCNADLTAEGEFDEVFVLAPLATTELGRFTPAAVVDRGYRLWVTRTDQREVEHVLAHGAAVELFAPNAADLAVIGVNMMNCASRREFLRRAERSTTERRAG